MTRKLNRRLDRFRSGIAEIHLFGISSRRESREAFG